MKHAKKTAKTVRGTPIPAGPAMQRAARRAREIARRYGTPVYVMRNGKIVAEKP